MILAPPLAALLLAGCLPSSGGPSIPSIPSSRVNDDPALSSPGTTDGPKNRKRTIAQFKLKTPMAPKSRPQGED